MHIVLLTDFFADISSLIIFVICRSVKKCARGEVNQEMLRQMFSVIEAEALNNIFNISGNLGGTSILIHFLGEGEGGGKADFRGGGGGWGVGGRRGVKMPHPKSPNKIPAVILSFGRVTIVNREMKKCQCYLIYDKANGNVARLEWVRDSLR